MKIHCISCLICLIESETYPVDYHSVLVNIQYIPTFIPSLIGFDNLDSENIFQECFNKKNNGRLIPLIRLLGNCPHFPVSDFRQLHNFEELFEALPSVEL